ncbi:fatty acid desaturase family protein [Glaciecola sp. MH2013]|uniref:fatty acid desaturase family protein n=1 Tax=Glaciecola sp. MH2013 TaxID=2785524 RepID=UPI00189CCB90|nr:fatty acid desaturase family protein [Glaciecola sp. MH2013]MBF7071823.1 fatty acid desaturase family protein [Glaciecola sp. MH2013]
MTDIRLDPHHLRAFTQKSDILGLVLISANWSLIALAFYLPVLLPYWPAYLLSVILLANRQLGIAILMHDASHYMLMKSRFLNLWLGRLLCGAPVLANLDSYRRYHLEHHKLAGSEHDPDYPNYKDYPITRPSLLRKILRDLLGITAIKMLIALIHMNAGIRKYDMVFKSDSNTQPDKKLSMMTILRNLISAFWQPVLVNCLLFGVLFTLGHGQLYLLWLIAFFTFYQLFARFRNAAEHASVPNLLDKNPFKHARTTKVSWWERLSFAPNYVNYHVEHHLRPNIPCYRLPAFHSHLRGLGFYDNVNIANGYNSIFSILIKK